MRSTSLILAIGLLPVVADEPTPTQTVCQIGHAGPGQARLTWNSHPGRTYAIERAGSLPALWQELANAPSVLLAQGYSVSYDIPIEPAHAFFRVVEVDRIGPKLTPLSPLDGSFAIGQQQELRARLDDQSGVDADSLTFQIGDDPAVTLADPRFHLDDNLLFYEPGEGEVLGEPGEQVTVKVSVQDLKGNETKDAQWTFRLKLPPVVNEQVVFVGTSLATSLRATSVPDLTLREIVEDTYVYSYEGTSSGLDPGARLVDSDPINGYTRTVLSVVDDPIAQTVSALTRQASLAELIDQGSVSSLDDFQESLPDLPGEFEPTANFQIAHTLPLARTLYQDEHFLLETTRESQLDLQLELALAAEIEGGELTSFEAVVTGTADFNLVLHAAAEAAWSDSQTYEVGEPISNFYTAFVGPIPVWVETTLSLEVGCSYDFQAEADLTEGFSGQKQVQIGRRWQAGEWREIWESPDPTFELTGPIWQFEGTANVRGFVRPVLTVHIYSLAGVAASLEPYLELRGSVQGNPPSAALALYAGMDATMALDLAIWDEDWGELPEVTFELIPISEPPLWSWQSDSGTLSPRVMSIQVEPSTLLPTGVEASLAARVEGVGPVTYQWQKDGIVLTDIAGRIEGSTERILVLKDVQSTDGGVYAVTASNVFGTHANEVILEVIPGHDLFGRNLLQNGDAEAGTASTTGEEVVEIPGWTAVGNVTVVRYDTPDFPTSIGPGPDERGGQFFAGGPGSDYAALLQTVDISAAHEMVDSLMVDVILSTFLGGWSTQDDSPSVLCTFRDESGIPLGLTRLDPVTAADRGYETGLLYRAASQTVPAHTRRIEVLLHMEHDGGWFNFYNDAYADNVELSLELRP